MKTHEFQEVKYEPTEQASGSKSSNKDEVLDNHNNLDGQFASNNWVISGKHTANGMPLLASDPHLGTGLPGFWLLQNMHIRTKIDEKNVKTEFVGGASMAGIPCVLFGRTNNITWGITAAITDTSDLYKEKIEGEKYLVDGEWRPLKKVVHNLKVKGQDKTEDFELFYTHRGPVVRAMHLKNA